MGGEDGHGHEPPYKVPSPKIYKVESVPQLMAARRALAGMGLKDPWLRNEIWKYGKHSNREIFMGTVGRGMKWGFVAAVITTAIGWAMEASEDPHAHGHAH